MMLMQWISSHYSLGGDNINILFILYIITIASFMGAIFHFILKLWRSGKELQRKIDEYKLNTMRVCKKYADEIEQLEKFVDSVDNNIQNQKERKE